MDMPRQAITIIAGVLLCIYIYSLILQIYEKRIMSKVQSLFKNGSWSWEYIINWKYAYSLPVSKLVEIIHSVNTNENDKSLIITKDLVIKTNYLSRAEILGMIVTYRFKEKNDYSFRGKSVVELAIDIREREKMSEVYSLNKAIWLLYANNKKYRSIFKKILENLYKKSKITKFTYIELKEMYSY